MPTAQKMNRAERCALRKVRNEDRRYNRMMDAEERNEARKARGHEGQLAKLDREGHAATRERARISKLVAEPEPKPKKKKHAPKPDKSAAVSRKS